jgi:hypothetical protein
MKRNRGKSSFEHLEAIVGITQQLIDQGLLASNKLYGYLAFGGWEAVVIAENQHMRLTWNDAAHRVDTSLCTSPPCNLASEWKSVGSTPVKEGTLKGAFQKGYDILAKHCG